MSKQQRFSISVNLDSRDAQVFDERNGRRVVADTTVERAEVIVRALNMAEAQRLEEGLPAVPFLTLEGVAVYVTALDARWSRGACLHCGNTPCDYEGPECLKDPERDEPEPLPAVTFTLRGDLVQAVLGPQVMAAMVETGDGMADIDADLLYLVGTDAEDTFTTALDMLVRWRADAVALLAKLEADHVTAGIFGDQIRDLLREGVIA